MLCMNIHACLHTMSVPGGCRQRSCGRRASDPLGLELQVPVRCHGSPQNQTQVLWESSKHFGTVSLALDDLELLM